MANRNRKGTKERKSRLPGGMKFRTEKGADVEELERKFKANNTGPILRIGENEELTVAIMNTPDEWSESTIYEHAISGIGDNNGWAYVPCVDNCPVCKRLPDNQARMYVFIPVYVYDNKRIQYFRAPSTIFTDLVKDYKRNKSRFLRNQYVLVRTDGSGPTRYDFDRQDAKVSSKTKDATIPDFEDTMSDRWFRGIEQLGWKVTGQKFEDKDDDDDDAFDHSDDDDLDLDDIKKMSRKQLIAVIDEYDLDIEEPEDFKSTKALRKAVKAELEDLIFKMRRMITNG